MVARLIPDPRALLRLATLVVAAALLLPLGIGCAAQAAEPAIAAHMDCEGKQAPAAPAHDCSSDCALACAALPVPPCASGREASTLEAYRQPAPVSLAHIVNGPAPPPPRG